MSDRNALVTGIGSVALIAVLLFVLAPQLRDSSASASGPRAAVTSAMENDLRPIEPMKIVPADPLSPDGISSIPLAGDGSN